MDIISKYGDVDKLTDELLIRRLAWKYIYKEDINKNGELISDYKKFLKISSDLLKELAITKDSLGFICMIEFLLGTGSFSYNNRFIVDKDCSEIVRSISGINVVNGFGCCRHVARFTTDLMLESGLYASNFYCVFDKEINKHSIDEDPTHVANLIVVDRNMYVYDIANGILFKFIDAINLEGINREYFLTFAPSALLTRERRDLKEIREMLVKFKEDSERDHVTKEEYLELREMTCESFVKNSSIIGDYKEEVMPLKTKIYEASKRNLTK